MTRCATRRRSRARTRSARSRPGAWRSFARKLGKTPEQRALAAEETLFEHFARALDGSEHETTLTTQYRMVPAIGELVSENFYGGALNHGRPADLCDRDPRVGAFAGDTQVRLLDIPGRQRRESPESKSNLRDEEIDQIAAELARLQECAASVAPPPERPGPLGVAVITPYVAQARRLNARLDARRYPDLKLRVGIVDRFQGDEDRVVIVSFVNTTYAGFLRKPNRINVALSRAEDLLIVTTDLSAALAGRIGEPLAQVAGFVSERARAGDDRYEIVSSRLSRAA